MVRVGGEFLTFLCWRQPSAKPAPVNRRIGATDSIQTACNLSGQLRVVVDVQQRISVVGNGNIDVGTKTPTRKTGKPSIQRLSGSNGQPELRIDQSISPLAERPKVCGAMTLQSGDSGWGNQSAPQKLLHLVGCREQKAPSELPQRPRPAKR
jgi:hypothetical protein